MFVQSLAFVALLVGEALAQDGFTHLNPGSLVRRQGQGFVPGTTPGCPSDWPFCGTSGICYLPSRGDTCCPGGTYACPGGSFCLVEPYCCPNGLDPQSCAEQHGITLPAGYSGATQPPASTPSLVATGASTLPAVIPTPPPAFQNSTTGGVPTVLTVPTTSSNPLFTGGASSQNILSGAAALAGVVGLLGNIL